MYNDPMMNKDWWTAIYIRCNSYLKQKIQQFHIIDNIHTLFKKREYVFIIIISLLSFIKQIFYMINANSYLQIYIYYNKYFY